MKYYLIIILILIYVFVTIWVFNHVSAWLSIFMLLMGIGTAIYFITKQLKQNQKEQ